MINSQDKGFAPTKLEVSANEQESIRSLPKYIAYKAAYLKEKMVLRYLIAIILMLFTIYFVVSRVEIFQLYKKLREKEYILAPGVQDFTTVNPQFVTDSYVHDAVSDFLSSLGNINSSNIVEEYDGLKKFMSEELKIKFEMETKAWMEQVMSEDFAQILKVNNKKIVSNENGVYHITAHAQADFYASGQNIGKEDQVIEMKLELTAPDRTRRWFLKITQLSWSKLADFNKKEMYEQNLNQEEK